MLTVATRALAVAVIGLGILYAMFVMSDQWLNYVLLAVAYSTIFLSITVITGMAGLVSMGQATFAAIGAYTVAQLAENQGSWCCWACSSAPLAAAVGGLGAACRRVSRASTSRWPPSRPPSCSTT